MVVKHFALPVRLIFCSQLRWPTCPDRNHMSIILSKYSVPPQYYGNMLGRAQSLPWKQAARGSGGNRQEGNRRVRWTADESHPKRHSSICFQAKSPCRSAAPSIHNFSGWYTPKKTVEEAVANQEGPRSESLGSPPPEVRGPSFEEVNEWTLERCAGILRQWGPVVTEDKDGNASSHSFAPFAKAGRTSSTRLQESGIPCPQPSGSVSADRRPVVTGSYWRLMRRCAHTSMPPPPK
jgi:hypothetical protein